MRRPYNRVTLSERDRAVIDIERRWGSRPSTLPMKLEDAHRRWGIDPRTYILVLNALIDDPLAHEAAPRTMARLREIREQHRAARSA